LSELKSSVAVDGATRTICKLFLLLGRGNWLVVGFIFLLFAFVTLAVLDVGFFVLFFFPVGASISVLIACR